MALTTRHWVMIALASCGLIAAAYLPPSKDVGLRRQRAFTPPEDRVRNLLRTQIRTHQEQLIFLAARDEILQWLDTQPATTPPIYFEPGMPATWQTAIRGTMQLQWEAVQPVGGEFRFALAFLTDRGGRDPQQRVPWLTVPRRRQLLPPATDGKTCLTIIPLSLSEGTGSGRADRVPPTYQPAYEAEYLGRNELMGPCAWYLAFGAPGPKIEEWFLSHGYVFAYDNRWNGPESTKLSAYYSNFGANSFEQIGCARGRREACLSVVKDSALVMNWRLRRNDLRQRGITTQSGVGGAQSFSSMRSLLADLLRAKGRDRFRAFWTSNLELEAAFAAAMGESLGDWTAAWAERHLEVPKMSPHIEFATTAWAVLIGLLAVAARTLAVTRRQVR